MPDTQHLPPLAMLQAFEAAARLRSFTAAARELGSTQSAVSQHIKRLEADIGTPLFQRIHRGVQLTRTGSSLHRGIAEGLTTLAEAYERSRQLARNDVINVATDYALGTYWLLPRLAGFRRAHPSVDVRLVTGQRPVTPDQADVDIALMFGNGYEMSAPTRLLFGESVVPVCAPGLLQGGDATASLADLPLLQLEADSAPWFDWPTLFEHLGLPGPPPEPALIFNNYTLLLQAALTGQGVAIGWSPFVEPLLENGALTALVDTPIRSDNGYQIVFPGSQAMDPLVLEFVDWLEAEGRRTEGDSMA
ncbi:choline sulfate utilization transcriptional regulator [Marinobacter sp. JSM 1782161]|uniref:choline sulfate utilization transcriptional regulator n=1 Tax=Marinobacter sp. JSM 1782161 TaxID=2685906 RepID=UPI001D18A7E6|nr:LysR substrate-binding domain-containing protein [Marinobacter sp. JSM 1782161]